MYHTKISAATTTICNSCTGTTVCVLQDATVEHISCYNTQRNAYYTWKNTTVNTVEGFKHALYR
jgi:hypothetical protein